MSGKKPVFVLVGSFVMPDKNALALHYGALTKLLEQLGYEVVYISWQPEWDHPGSGWIQKAYEGKTCYELPYPNSASQWLKGIFNTKTYIEILTQIGTKNIFAVMVDGIKYFNAKGIYDFCRRAKIHYIYHSSEWMREWTGSVNGNVNVLSTWLEMHVHCPKIKNVVSVSQFTLDQLKKHPGMQLYHMPVFTDKQDPRWSPEASYSPAQIVHIGYAGNLDRIGYKERIDWLVKAACEINRASTKVKIHIIGVTAEKFREACPDIAAVETFDNTVVFYGRLPQRQCVKKLCAMDYNFIVREKTWNMLCGFPTKLGESFSCGVPVLISNFGGIDAFVQEGRTGWLLDEITYDRFYEYLETAVNCSPEVRAQMHKECENEQVLDYRSYGESLKAYLAQLQ